MLVLSRRRDEKLVLPTLGVTIHVLGCNGNSVRIGIDAPPDVKILRHEIAEDAEAAATRHAARNALNRLTLAVHLAQRQLQAGQDTAARASLEHALNLIERFDAQRSADVESPAREAARRWQTLVVEDDDNQRELLAGFLQSHGCECATAADGQHALDYLAAHNRPDFVLLDMFMPRSDGPDTLARIRRDPRLYGMKVFSVSGTAPQQLGIATGPDGVDDWFPKPLNPRTLWDALSRHLTSPTPN